MDLKFNFTIKDYFYGCSVKPLIENDIKISKKFTCLDCKKVFKNNFQLMNHAKIKVLVEWLKQSKREIVFCNFCYRTFDNEEIALDHVKNIHKLSKETTCEICEKQFDDNNDMFNHMKSFHNPIEMPYKCQVCFYQTSYFCNLFSHFKSCHEDTEYLLCYFCLEVFKCQDLFLKHIFQHSIVCKKHQCNSCRLFFTSMNSKKSHYQRSHNSAVKDADQTVIPKNILEYSVKIRFNSGLPSDFIIPKSHTKLRCLECQDVFSEDSSAKKNYLENSLQKLKVKIK